MTTRFAQFAKDCRQARLVLPLALWGLVGAAQSIAPRPEGLVAWWPGDGTAQDVVGTNRGELRNGTAFAAGEVGQALAFDGVDDYVAIPDHPSLHSARARTVMCWLQASRLSPTWQCLLWQGTGGDSSDSTGANRECGLWVNADGHIHFVSTSTDRVGVGQTALNTASGAVAAGSWYHCAGVIDADAGKIRIYLNGVQAAEGAYSTSGTIRGTGPLFLGVASGGPTPFAGQIDEVALFNRALTPAEIAAIYAAGAAGMAWRGDPAPVFTTQPQPQWHYSGGAATFVAAAMGDPRPTLRWLHNDTPVEGATKPILTLADLTAEHAGTYRLEATNTAGTVLSDPVELTLLPNPVSPAFLSGPVFNPANGHYYWLLKQDTWTNSEATAVAIGAHLVTVNDAAENAWLVSTFITGTSRCPWIGLTDREVEGTFTWTSGQTSTYRNWGSGEPNNTGGTEDYVHANTDGKWNDLADVSSQSTHPLHGVVEAALGRPIFLTQPVGALAYVGEALTLTCVVDGAPNPTLQWYKGDQPIEDATQPTLAFASLALADAGTYTLVATNTYGTVTSAAVVLTVNAIRFPAEPEGFEYGRDGWNSDNPAVWQFGAPTVGPAANGSGSRAHEGTNCAGTVLGGSYGNNADSRLISPVFTVPAADQYPRLRFWSWTQTYGSGDYGRVLIRSGSAAWATLSGQDFSGAGAAWNQTELDLADYAGQAVQVAFLFHSDGGSTAAGWYVDEVTLVTGAVAPLVANVPESFESGWGDWSVEGGGPWELGAATSGPRGAHQGANCVATTLGGNYPEWHYWATGPGYSSRMVSPAFVVPAAGENPRLRFWQWYSFNVGPDYGEFQIKVGTETWQRLARYEGHGSGVWSRPVFDLSAYAGQSVRVGFLFGAADGDYYNANVDAGWYLDEVTLVTGAEALNNPETFENGWGDWWTDNYQVWREVTPGAGGTGACLGTTSTGRYAASVSGRLVSPSFLVPPPGTDGRTLLRFDQRYQYGTGDSGALQIAIGSGTAWTDWIALDTPAPAGGTSGWARYWYDLSAYQHQKLRLGFLHTANADSSTGTGWFIDNVELSQFVPLPAPLDGTATGHFANVGERQVFRVDVPAGGHLTLNVAGPAGANLEIYARRGALPSAGVYDYRYSGPASAAPELFISDAQAGAWYIMVYAAQLPTAGDVTLSSSFGADIVLRRVTPTAAGNTGTATVGIEGAGFDGTAAVVLQGSGTGVEPAALTVYSSTRIGADFDLTGLAPGTYSLTVTQGTTTASLPFEVIRAAGARLETRIIVPSAVGRHAINTVYVEYANTGDTAMPAPLLVVHGSDRALLTLDVARVSGGFWTSAKPAGFEDTVQLVANGASAGVLQPGESFRVPVYFAGLLQPWDFGDAGVEFSVGVLESTDSTVADWETLRAGMRPDYVRPDAWEAVWANFASQVGGTWGGYLAALDQNAAYLGRLGAGTSEISRLLAFELRQADALNPIRYLARGTDAAMPAPGPSLVFARAFAQPISRRYEIGPLGRGWAHAWQWFLVKETDGTVRITGMTGTPQIFQPDSRAYAAPVRGLGASGSRAAGMAYFAAPGDHDVLTGFAFGVFQLRKPDGTLYLFRADGHLDYVQDTNGNQITCGYEGGLLTSLTHSAGQNLTIAYNGSGRIQSVTDSDGRQTQFTYDAGGEHLAAVQAYDGRTTRYAYSSGQGATREHALTEIAYPDGSHRFFSYDVHGRLGSVAADGDAGRIGFGYDSVGTVTATNALGHASRFCFDDYGQILRVSNALGHSVMLTLDDERNVTRVTDPAGRVYGYDYDATGNLTRFIDSIGNATRFSYTLDYSRLANLVDASGNLTRYIYDSHANLRTIVYADGSSEGWTYDTTGLPQQWTNRRGQAIAVTWDGDGRPTRKTYPDGTRVDYAYDVKGNLESTTDNTGTTTYGYDTQEYLTRIDYPGGQSLEFTYDTGGRRASSLDQSGHRLEYRYDAPGRLSHILDEAGTKVVHYHYDAASRLVRKDLGNGVYTTYEYDAAGQLLELVNRRVDDSVLSLFVYTYDSRGRRTGMTTSDGTWTYGYDDLGQLTRAVFDSLNPDVADQDLTYVYDALGNRTLTVENGVSTAYTSNSLNQYTRAGDTTYRFDRDGNLTEETTAAGTTTYSYDPENRLIGVSKGADTWSYTYDAFGQRVATDVNGTTTRFVLDPIGLGNVVGEYDADGSRIAGYDHGFGLLSRTDAAGESAYYTFDALGSTSEMTGPTGSVLNRYVYAPFGGTLLQTGSLPNPFQFVGRLGVMAEGHGLSFMRARFYDSQAGRFTQADPVGLAGNDMNLQRYAFNSPTSFTDPVGLGVIECDDADRRIIEDLRTAPYTRWVEDMDKGPEWNHFKELFRFDPKDPADLLDWSNKAIEVAKVGSLEPLFPSFWELALSALADLIEYIFPAIPNPDDYGNRSPTSDPTRTPTPPTTPGGGDRSRTVGSFDPNQLTGPAGYLAAGYVSPIQDLAYRIDFENDPAAPAPAHDVRVSNLLVGDLDRASFYLTEIGFGDRLFAIPPRTQHYEQTVAMAIEGVAFEVRIEAGIHLDTGEVYARFQSIVPETGLPPPVEAGFLPPEDGTGRGMGHISYVIRPKPGLATDTAIRNIARIKFDTNDWIATNQVDPHNPGAGTDPAKEALVTIDAGAPTSAVEALPLRSIPGFVVSWSGTDAESGVASYTAYVQRDGGAFEAWLTDTFETSAFYAEAEVGHTYSFYCVATDNVGNREVKAPLAEASTGVEPPLPLDLHVRSTPRSGVAVTGSAPGTTDYQKTILEGTLVTLTAPALHTAPGGGMADFVAWQGMPAGATLSAGGSTVSFTMLNETALTAAYARQTGTVVVEVTPASAPWSFVDGEGETHTGAGPATVTGVPTGTIGLSWLPLAGHLAPAAPSAQDLLFGGTVTFSDSYTRAYLVRFLAAAHGSLSGEATQEVAEGTDASPVEAVPDRYYVFTGWLRADGSLESTQNPRVLTSVTAPVSLTASFRPAGWVPPVGHFEANLDAGVAAAGHGLWDLTGHYETPVGEDRLTMELLHDAGGTLTGSAVLQVPVVGGPLAIPLQLKGSVKGRDGSVLVRLTPKGGAVAVPAVAGGGKASAALQLTLTLDAAGRRLGGPVSGSRRLGRATTRYGETVVLDLPTGMDGSYRFRFDLQQAGTRIDGQAELRLASGRTFALLVKGELVGTACHLSLTAAPADRAARAMRVTLVAETLEAGQARITSLSMEGLGQSISW